MALAGPSTLPRRYGPAVTDTDTRAADEAEALRWARRRRLVDELTTVGFAVGYGAVLLVAHAELAAFAVAFPFLAVAVRYATWRWRDRAVEARRARVGYSLRQHRLVGWARTEQVTEEAAARVERTGWRRLGLGLCLAGLVVLVVVTLRMEPPLPVHALLGAVVAVGLVAGVLREERDRRDARRWLADPPA